MKIKNVLPGFLAILVIIVALSSCKEDFNDIGAGIIGDEAINGELLVSPVVAYSRQLTPQQSNNLPNYQLGVYNDPVFGKTTANILSQVTQVVAGTEFGTEVEIDSVFLYIPFLSTPKTTSDTTTTYRLDSVYGSAPISLNVYESKYFLREFDPTSGFQEEQKYYSDQKDLFENNLGTKLASDTVTVSNEGILLKDKTKEKDSLTTLPPGIRIKLSMDFFETKIVDKGGSADLDNNNNFKNYFRGIYLQSGSINDDGFLALLDLTKANIIMSYKSISKNGGTDKTAKKYALRLMGVTVNVYDNPLPAQIEQATANPDTINGESTLYLKKDILTVVQLFGKDNDGNGVGDELDQLRVQKPLITEADLFLYVDQDKVNGGSKEPERITIYDLKNNTPLVDYILDPLIGSPGNELNAYSGHLGRLKRDENGNGEYYKIRITNHVSNLINKDSTNVPLGIIVSSNILRIDTRNLKSKVPPVITKVPVGSTISPEGTVLYGNNTTNEAKKLKLQIYYTEPK